MEQTRTQANKINIRLTTGHSMGMTEYMFQDTIPVFAKMLSLYHVWLPVLLLYLIGRNGYDRRSFLGWTTIIWVALIICYLFTPPPPIDPNHPNSLANINYVYGPSRVGSQTWMHPHLYFGLLMLGLPMLIYMPTHFVLQKLDTRLQKVFK